MTNPYAELGVKRDATIEQITRAYRLAVRRFHPDNGSEPDSARFQAVGEARELLSDPAKRAEFDATGMVPSGPEHLAAQNLLKNVFGQFINSKADENPFESVRVELNRIKAEAEADHARLAELKSRVTHVKPGVPDPWEVVILQLLGQAEKAVANFTLALSYLDHWEYKAPPPPPSEQPPQWAYGNSFNWAPR